MIAGEDAALRRLREILTLAAPGAPALARQLEGVDIASLRTRADLARIPVLRKSELREVQQSAPPFGGLSPAPVSGLRRLLVSPGPIFEPEAEASDWWAASRALAAAGIRAGDVVLNCFSYHLTPGGHIMESGARALGCPVIPAGTAPVEQQLEAIAQFRPDAYCGTPDFLKVLIERGRAAGVDVSSIRRALVSGAALPPSLRATLGSWGIVVRQAYATADLGVIAYEVAPDGQTPEGMVVNEGAILEIVTPGGGDPAPEGKVGEIVVTRLNPEYPLLRFATGDLSAFLVDGAHAGAPRIKGWMGRADQTTKVRGMFVHPAQVLAVARRHPELGPVRLVVGRVGEQDDMILRAEIAAPPEGLADAVATTLAGLTKLRGRVEFVAPGALPNDGKIIADERPAV